MGSSFLSSGGESVTGQAEVVQPLPLGALTSRFPHGGMIGHANYAAERAVVSQEELEIKDK